MTTQEQLAAIKATREAHAARLKAIGDTAAGEGRSMNTAEAEEFDTLEKELDDLEANEARYERLAAREVATAAPVQAKTFQPTAGRDNAPVRTNDNLNLKTVEKLEPGIAFARQAICLFHAKGDVRIAAELAEKHYPNTSNVVKVLKAQAQGANLQQILMTKATVPAGTTTDATWAAPLVYQQTTSQDFIEFLRARSLIGQAQFRPIPFNVRIPRQTSGGTAKWTGQGKSKPLTKFDFDAINTAFTKVAAVSVITEELARFSDPAAEALIRDQLADTVIERLDTDLFDPDLAPDSGVNPGGLLYGVAPVAGPGGSPDSDDIACAILRLWTPWDASFMGARPAYYTTPGVLRYLAFLRDALGNRVYPNITANGGTIDGVPVRVSQYLANNGGSGGAPFILVDEAEIYMADDGVVTLDASREATIEMSDTPVGSTSATVTSNGSPFVNMFQTNSIAIRAERYTWWGPRRAGAIQWIDGMPSGC